MYNYISGLRTDSYVLFHPRSNTNSVPSKNLTRLTPRGRDRKRQHQPTPQLPSKPPTRTSNQAGTYLRYHLHPRLFRLEENHHHPPPPLPHPPSTIEQTHPKAKHIIRSPWPVPWTHAGYKPRHHAPLSEPSLVQPSPGGRVGGFGFRLSARVCRRVYLAFRVSLSSKARQRLSRLERAGKRASK